MFTANEHTDLFSLWRPPRRSNAHPFASQIATMPLHNESRETSARSTVPGESQGKEGLEAALTALTARP